MATASAWRRRGLARQLSQLARDEFWKLGGDAIFLGTVNPQAAPLYESLGWRRLTGANVMCLVRNDGSSDDFLADYFQPVPWVLRGGGERSGPIGDDSVNCVAS